VAKRLREKGGGTKTRNKGPFEIYDYKEKNGKKGAWHYPISLKRRDHERCGLEQAVGFFK